MQTLDPIESALARLMPPALSREGQQDIEAMLDDLAGKEVSNVTEISNGRWFTKWAAGGGIAAAIGALCALNFTGETVPGPPAAYSGVQEMSSGLIIVSGGDRVESLTDEGWQEDANGKTMQAVRVKVVEENNVLDEESGIMMKISEPREEILLVPVGSY